MAKGITLCGEAKLLDLRTKGKTLAASRQSVVHWRHTGFLNVAELSSKGPEPDVGFSYFQISDLLVPGPDRFLACHRK
jgi:hypothetical protein